MNDLIAVNQIQDFNNDWQYCLDNFLRTQNGLAYKTIKAYKSLECHAFLITSKSMILKNPSQMIFMISSDI